MRSMRETDEVLAEVESLLADLRGQMDSLPGRIKRMEAAYNNTRHKWYSIGTHATRGTLRELQMCADSLADMTADMATLSRDLGGQCSLFADEIIG